MKLNEARAIAVEVMEKLKPCCQRIAIGGSIRREAELVGDIELICIPLKVENVIDETMFGREVEIVNSPEFSSTVENLGQIIKGTPQGKYIQIALDKINLDLFIANPENWGLIYAIRTGSATFSHEILAKGWVKKGYHAKEGVLYNKAGEPVEVREEQDLFDIIGVPFWAPQKRSL